MSDFIDDFCEFSSGICESPMHFHKVVALYVLSAAIGRRLYTLHMGQPTYPNIFALLVGPSAKVQKSTVGNIGVNCLRSLGDVEIFQDRCTRAYLGERLYAISQEKGESVITIFVPELRTAFNEMTLNEGILEALTSLYDCPPVHEYRLKYNTPGGKILSMLHPCISFLACSTPEWLTIGLSRDEIGGGFAGRCMIIFGDKPHARRDYQREAPPKAVAAEKRMLERLLQIREMQGELLLDRGAARLWSSFRRTQDKAKVEGALEAYHNRMHSHLFKISMLLSAARSSDMRLTELDMLNAIELLKELEPHMRKALSGIAPSRINIEGDKIVRILESNDGAMTHVDLISTMCRKRIALDPRELKTVLTVLIQSAQIERCYMETENKQLIPAYRLRKEKSDNVNASERDEHNEQTLPVAPGAGGPVGDGCDGSPPQAH